MRRLQIERQHVTNLEQFACRSLRERELYLPNAEEVLQQISIANVFRFHGLTRLVVST